MNLPLAHVQGGEVTGSIDEKVRHAVSKLADLHLVSSRRAAERLCRMGEEPKTIVVTGCPSIDLASQILDDPALNFDPIERGDIVVFWFPDPYSTEHSISGNLIWFPLVFQSLFGRNHPGMVL